MRTVKARGAKRGGLDWSQSRQPTMSEALPFSSPRRPARATCPAVATFPTATCLEAELVRPASQPLPQALRALVRQLLATTLENPRLHQVLHELVPKMRQLGQVDPHEQRLFRLVRAFLVPRAAALRPRDLDMAVFIPVHSVETLCIEAVSDRPDSLTNETFIDGLCALMQGYLQPEEESPSSGRAPPKRATGRRRNPTSREISTSS